MIYIIYQLKQYILVETLPTVSRSLCEKQTAQLNCPENYHIELNSMFYGRVDNDSCDDSNIFTLDCPTPDGALSKLRGLCEGRTTCNFEARSELWGDNCRSTFKAANVSFTCHCKYLQRLRQLTKGAVEPVLK